MDLEKKLQTPQLEPEGQDKSQDLAQKQDCSQDNIQDIRTHHLEEHSPESIDDSTKDSKSNSDQVCTIETTQSNTQDNLNDCFKECHPDDLHNTTENTKQESKKNNKEDFLQESSLLATPLDSSVDSSNEDQTNELFHAKTIEQASDLSKDHDSSVTLMKIGDDVSSITGRPHVSAEENASLKSRGHFGKRALESAARAKGEEYEPFQLPANMRLALSQIDQESSLQKRTELLEQAKREGKDLSIEDIPEDASAISSLHAIDPEEVETLRKQKEEEARIAAGGARFYGKYQDLIARQNVQKEISRMHMLRNLKILMIVVVGMFGYLAYNFFFVDKEAESIADLKASLPLTIDKYTSMVRIDDRNNEFKIYFEKDPAVFQNIDEHQKEAMLDNLTKNAPLLCKNPLLRSIINDGKKVTVLLEASDRSFFREFTVEKCDNIAPSTTQNDVPKLDLAE